MTAFTRLNGETGVDLRARVQNDPMFHHLFRMVYGTIASGEVTVTDWRDAVNLAFTEWTARNVGPIIMVDPDPERDGAA